MQAVLGGMLPNSSEAAANWNVRAWFSSGVRVDAQLDERPHLPAPRVVGARGGKLVRTRGAAWSGSRQ